jgi:hypothetical protein
MKIKAKVLGDSAGSMYSGPALHQVPRWFLSRLALRRSRLILSWLLFLLAVRPRLTPYLPSPKGINHVQH